MQILSKTLLTIVAAAGVFAGSSCVLFPLHIEHKYKDLSEEEKVLYHGTESGFHRLSEFFAVRVKNDHLRGSMQIYHYIDGKESKELIGELGVKSFDYADYGRPDEHFMLSGDGRALLFFNAGGHGKPSGLYRFRHGEGERLLVEDVYVQGGNKERHTLSYCAPASAPLRWECHSVCADD